MKISLIIYHRASLLNGTAWSMIVDSSKTYLDLHRRCPSMTITVLEQIYEASDPFMEYLKTQMDAVRTFSETNNNFPLEDHQPTDQNGFYQYRDAARIT